MCCPGWKPDAGFSDEHRSRIGQLFSICPYTFTRTNWSINANCWGTSDAAHPSITHVPGILNKTMPVLIQFFTRKIKSPRLRVTQKWVNSSPTRFCTWHIYSWFTTELWITNGSRLVVLRFTPLSSSDPRDWFIKNWRHEAQQKRWTGKLLTVVNEKKNYENCPLTSPMSKQKQLSTGPRHGLFARHNCHGNETRVMQLRIIVNRVSRP